MGSDRRPGRGEIRFDLGEKPKDEVDQIVHDAACLKVRLMEGQPATWICVDTCPLRDHAMRVVTAPQMEIIRAAMEAEDAE